MPATLSRPRDVEGAPRRPRRLLRRLVAIVSGLLFLFVAFAGAVHVKAFRPFFARLGIGCPAWGVKGADVARVRERGLASLRGDRVAASRPALGLQLDRTTQADALSWARGAGLTCIEKTLGLPLVECTGKSTGILGDDDGGRDVLALSFDQRGLLITVDVMRRGLDGVHAEQVLSSIDARLAPTLGPATEQAGAPTGDYLSSGPMHTALMRWRFTDYLAFVTASNLPSGICIHEIYQSASAPSS